MRKDGDGFLDHRRVGNSIYDVRLNALCATAECVALQANVDWTDQRSEHYRQALSADLEGKMKNTVTSVVMVSGAGFPGRVAGGLSLAWDFGQAAAGDLKSMFSVAQQFLMDRYQRGLGVASGIRARVTEAYNRLATD